MYCTRCGLKLEPDALFCTACGQSTSLPAAPIGVAGEASVSAASAPPVRYGGFWVRATAYSIDGLIVDVPLFLLLLLTILSRRATLRRLGAFDSPDALTGAPPFGPSHVFPGLFAGGILFFLLVFFVVHWLYFAGMESSSRQATFGKAAMSLRVADIEGRRLSFAHASGRFFAKIVSSIVPLGIGYLLAGLTPKKQALHDMIAGTLVFRE